MFDEIKDQLSVSAEAGTENKQKSICPLCSYKQKTFYSTDEFFICHHCHKKGDIFSFVMYRDSLPDRVAAMKALAERLGIKQEVTELQRIRHQRAEVYKVMAERFCALPPEALLYCRSRGLTDETIQNKLIGYIPEDCAEYDKETGLPGILKGRLLIPFWQHGEIVYYTGRALDDRKPKYLNQKGEKQYTGTVKGPVLYVTEGPIDQLMAEQAGYNCIALAGSGKMPFIKSSVKRVVFAFDGDAAGAAFVEKHGLPLCDIGLPVEVLMLPEGQDVASWLQAHGSVDGLETVPLLTHYLTAFEADPKNADKKEALYRTMRPLDELDREAIFKKIKDIRKCTEKSVRKDFSNFIGQERESKYSAQDGIVLKVPEGYKMTQAGITVDGVHITYEPYYISRLGKNLQTGTEYCETVIGKDKRRVVERRTIAISSQLVEESNAGAPVHSGNMLQLVKFLDAWIARNRVDLDQFDVTSCLGWIDQDRFAMPDRIIGKLNQERELIYKGGIEAAAYSKGGTLQGWIDAIKVAGSKAAAWPVRCMLYAGFASVALERIGHKPFIIHIHGDTSTGKTTALMVPASIYGQPTFGKAMIRWKNTQNYIIRQAENLKNLPLILDELSSEEREHESTIYMLESGLSKGKALKDDPHGVAKQRTFAMGVFSSGEVPILNTHSKGGALVRTWEFLDPPFGVSNNSAHVERVATGLQANYGHAIDEFLKCFDVSAYQDMSFVEGMAEFIAAERKAPLQGMETRVLTAMNPICIAGLAANKMFGLDWDPVQDVGFMAQRAIEPLKAGGMTIEKIIEEIQAWVGLYPGSFPVAEPGMTPSDAVRSAGAVGVWGYIYKNNDGTQDIAIIKKKFEEVFDGTNKTRNLGKSVVNLLYSKGIINEKRKIIRLQDRTVPCVYIPEFYKNDEKEPF